MNKVLIAAALFAGSVVSASAADLPMRAPALIAAPAFSWTACHVGANVGGIWDESRAELRTGPGAYFTPAAVAPPPNALGTGLLGGDYRSSRYSNFRESGVTGGVGWGCDWQTLGPIVVGTQSDLTSRA